MLRALLRYGLIVQVEGAPSNATMIRHSTRNTARIVRMANLRQIARCESTDRQLLVVIVKEVTLRSASNRALHGMVLGRRYSDTWHRCQYRILFDGLAYASLELVQVHAPRLLHYFCNA